MNVKHATKRFSQIITWHEILESDLKAILRRLQSSYCVALDARSTMVEVLSEWEPLKSYTKPPQASIVSMFCISRDHSLIPQKYHVEQQNIR